MSLTAAEANRLCYPNGKSRVISKTEQYHWTTKDDPGVFSMLSKHELKVDDRYQRDKIANSRVLSMAKAWSWIACGVLIVARRANGEYLVIDGQHRKLAADRRADIQHLPCMVFDVPDVALEAQGFLDANTHRGPVPKIAKFRAELVANDPISIKVKDMVEASGYRITAHGNRANGTVSCIAALQDEMKYDADLCHRTWALCVELTEGGHVIDRLFQGIAQLERTLIRKRVGMSVFDKNNRDALQRIGVTHLLQCMRNAATYHGKGGSRYYAEGIVQALNKGRRTRHIPSMTA